MTASEKINEILDRFEGKTAGELRAFMNKIENQVSLLREMSSVNATLEEKAELFNCLNNC